jgi:hypothetical protein
MTPVMTPLSVGLFEDRIRLSNRSRPARNLPRTGRLDFDRDQVRSAPWQGLVDVPRRCSVVGTR